MARVGRPIGAGKINSANARSINSGCGRIFVIPLSALLSCARDCRYHGCHASFEARPKARARRRAAVLAAQGHEGHDPGRVGEPVRRLRPLLPQQADGGGHRPHLLHRRRLQAARWHELPLHRLQEPLGEGEGLRHADLAQHQPHLLAAADLRLQARRRRQGSVLVASAGLRRPGHRASLRSFGARQGRRERGRRAGRAARGSHRELAAEVAEGREAVGQAPVAKSTHVSCKCALI